MVRHGEVDLMELTISNWILIAIGCIFLMAIGFYLIGLIIVNSEAKADDFRLGCERLR
jgi:hypothetical protein